MLIAYNIKLKFRRCDNIISSAILLLVNINQWLKDTSRNKSLTLLRKTAPSTKSPKMEFTISCMSSNLWISQINTASKCVKNSANALILYLSSSSFSRTIASITSLSIFKQIYLSWLIAGQDMFFSFNKRYHILPDWSKFFNSCIVTK